MSENAAENRKELREAVLAKLTEMGIAFEMDEHEPVYTIEEMDALGITAKGLVAKNLFLRDAKGKRHFLVLLPGEKHADVKKIEAQAGSTHLSFASDERLMKYLGLTKGAVTPFGLLNDENQAVEVLLDQGLRGKPRIGFHPNENTATLWVSYDDLMKFLKERGNKVKFVNL